MSEEQIDPIIVKDSRADRYQRDEAARKRRREMKKVRSIHAQKEEHDAVARFESEIILEKNKKAS